MRLQTMVHLRSKRTLITFKPLGVVRVFIVLVPLQIPHVIGLKRALVALELLQVLAFVQVHVFLVFAMEGFRFGLVRTLVALEPLDFVVLFVFEDVVLLEGILVVGAVVAIVAVEPFLVWVFGGIGGVLEPLEWEVGLELALFAFEGSDGVGGGFGGSAVGAFNVLS